MKVSLDQQLLLQCLKTVSRAVSGQNTLPVLGNILLRAEGSMLSFSATNLELSITTACEVHVAEEGAITVPAKIFTSYVSLLSDAEEVELSQTTDIALQVKTPSSKTKIKGIAADEFPAIQTVEGGTLVSFDASGYRTAVHQVAFAAQENSSRPILGGVYVVGEGQTFTMVATDSYRLSEKKIELGEAVDAVKAVIPVRAVLEADRLAAKAETVNVRITNNQAAFEVGDTVLTTRLIEGTFPDYTQIVPKQHLTEMHLSRHDLEMAVRRVSIFARQNNQHMRLDIESEGHVRVYTDKTEVGEDSSTLTATVDGKANVIALNADYLLGALSALGDTDDITIRMQEKMNPAVISPKGDDTFLHLIMPLKM